MARASRAPGSKRRHGDARRDRKVTALFNDGELAALRAEAARRGMMPAAMLAQLGTDAAAGRIGAGPDGAADVVAAMSTSTSLARRLGYLLNQAVARLHATGEHSPTLDASADAVARSVAQMEADTLRAARLLRPR